MVSETLTRLATELESLSVQHIGTRSIQHPDLYRIACELRTVAESVLTTETESAQSETLTKQAARNESMKGAD